MNRLLALVILASTLIGCSKQVLDLRTESLENMVELKYITIATGRTLYVSEYKDSYDCYFPQPIIVMTIGEDGVRRGSNNVILIDVKNRPSFTTLVGYQDFKGGGVLNCQLLFTIDLAPKTEYQIVIDGNDKQCAAITLSRGLTEKKWRPVIQVEREFKQPLWKGGWCTPDETYRGSSALKRPRGPESVGENSN
ncbi:hypothetical protein [Pseudomonas kuykendallii]|uniref:hypothetical protein n=1 Tax=Pseudomonas kuykendallii TaxID=1007099 RepID=UPI00235360A9|nr:hypothetical protein [Pseudomonas kuykendallii]